VSRHACGPGGQPGRVSKPLGTNRQAAVDPHVAELISACRRVPYLDAYATEGGKLCLVLDGRLGLELSEADACAVVPFIVECFKAASQR
jgi:hypothetical protein